MHCFTKGRSWLTLHLKVPIRSEDLELHQGFPSMEVSQEHRDIPAYATVDRSTVFLEFILDTPRLANSDPQETVSDSSEKIGRGLLLTSSRWVEGCAKQSRKFSHSAKST